MKRHSLPIVILLFTLMVLGIPAGSQAAPLWQISLNEETKECANLYRRDECGSCELPEGWEATDLDSCPDDYTEADDIRVKCKLEKTQRCCTEGSSGGIGDCIDLVINETSQTCAFVDDITQCATLPEGWRSVDPARSAPTRCPNDYSWDDEQLECEAGANPAFSTTNDGVAAVGNETESADEETKDYTLLLIILSVIAIILIGFLVYSRTRPVKEPDEASKTDKDSGGTGEE